MLTRWNSTGWPIALWGDVGVGGFGEAFASLERMRREMDRTFSQVGTALAPPVMTRAGLAEPRITLEDRGEKYLLRAELPGVKPDDLELTLEANRVTLRGQRRDDAPDGYSVYQKERRTLSFAKSFSLPGTIDAEAAVATLRHGVLTLELPKAAEARPRQIPIKT